MIFRCRSPVRVFRRWGRLFSLLLLMALAAGCATSGNRRGQEGRRALRRIPEVPEGFRRADQAMVSAFFRANGIVLTPREIDSIISPAAPQGHINRQAIRRIASRHDHLVIIIKADEEFLWDELGQNLPLLVQLPPNLHYSPVALPMIPVAWDRDAREIGLLDGNGEIHSIPDIEFFARREPLKQAALCLVKPSGFRHFEPTRQQKLLLADFWYDKGFYRRAQAVYDGLQKIELTGKDTDALIGQGNILVMKKKYRDAIPVFRAALAMDPDNPRILNNLAYAMLHGDGELLTALRHATKASELDPNNPIILETLGSINLKIGDALTAAKYLEHAWGRALKRSPEIQIAIMDQLVRAWLAADREDLAWQVAEYRYMTYPEYRMPKDIMASFPALKKLRYQRKKSE